MNQQESIAHQFGLMYRVTASNLERMTPEQSLAQPSPGGNCANWILGHLTNVQNGVMQLLGARRRRRPRLRSSPSRPLRRSDRHRWARCNRGGRPRRTSSPLGTRP